MSTLTINNSQKIQTVCQSLSNITYLQGDYIDATIPQEYKSQIFIPQELVGVQIQFEHNVTYRRCDAVFNAENKVRVLGVEGSILSSTATTNSVPSGSTQSVSNTFSYIPTQSGYIYLEFVKNQQFISPSGGEYFVHVDSQLIPNDNNGGQCSPSFLDLNFMSSNLATDCYTA